MWTARTARRRSSRPNAASACSRTVESSPPLNATTSPVHSGGTQAVSATSRAVRLNAGLVTGEQSRFAVHPVPAQPLAALREQLIGGQLVEVPQVTRERVLDGIGNRLRIAVRAAERLLDDFIDDTEFRDALGADAHRLGGEILLLVAAPEDARAALRGDHGEDAVLEHEQAVGHGERECATRPAFADHDAHDRRSEP